MHMHRKLFTQNADARLFSLIDGYRYLIRINSPGSWNHYFYLVYNKRDIYSRFPLLPTYKLSRPFHRCTRIVACACGRALGRDPLSHSVVDGYPSNINQNIHQSIKLAPLNSSHSRLFDVQSIIHIHKARIWTNKTNHVSTIYVKLYIINNIFANSLYINIFKHSQNT